MWRVRTTFTGVQGSPWLSTMHFLDDVGSAAQAVTAVGAFWGAVDALMNTGVSWSTDADVATVNPATGAVTGITATTPQTGTGATVTEVLPPATQAIVRWRTGVFVAGREIRGRTFIPGLTELANTAGTVTAASRTTIQTAADALIADANSALAVWSKSNGQVEDALTGSVWTSFAVLRSRRD